jgi:hypothetical protein
MSQHDRGGPARLALVALAVVALPARGQTIGDYSRAQRMLLESAMTQAAARSAGLGASAPAPAAAASTVAGPPAAPARMPPSSLPPVLQVGGVFASSAGSVTEVIVNATAYLLGAGQGVPGTPWHVESIAIDRVVLSRGNVHGAAADADGPRRTFPLPALR